MINEKKLIEEIEKNDFSTQNDDSVSEKITTYVWNNAVKRIIRRINNHPKVGEWIPCSERLPEEHNTMFAKFKGTEKWDKFMWKKQSDDVNVTVEFEDGTCQTRTMHTCDGKWHKGQTTLSYIVIAWMPLPEPYKETD